MHTPNALAELCKGMLKCPFKSSRLRTTSLPECTSVLCWHVPSSFLRLNRGTILHSTLFITMVDEQLQLDAKCPFLTILNRMMNDENAPARTGRSFIFGCRGVGRCVRSQV